MITEELKEKVSRLPDQPGVYLLKDKNGRVIYVGKAISLRKRVRSYLAENVSGSPRLKSLQGKLQDLDFIVTDSEVEALILECNLIKEYRPRFNVTLKDDKDYPYLLITPELYPRLELLRLTQKGSKRGRYEAYPGREEKLFGPYTDVGAVKETIKFLGTLFPLRRCRRPLDGSPAKTRPCLNYQIGRCLAPCRGQDYVDPADYYEMVKQIELFLQGSYSALEKTLKTKMLKAAAGQRFEEAARLRDRLQALKQTAGQQQKMLQAEKNPDRDILALVRLEERASVQLFKIRGGKLLNQDHFILAGAEELPDQVVLSSFIKSYYHHQRDIPKEILLSELPEESELFERWLTTKAARKVKMRRPKRGALKKLLELALRNGLLRLEEERALESRFAEDPLEELRRLLGLDTAPERIEAYDVSHFKGDQPVGSMVVFLEGEPLTKDYRRFNINQAAAGDDYAALSEMLIRRANNISWPRPDLILIDGGRGQLKTARRALAATSLKDIALVALAENPDRLFLETSALPARLFAHDPLLKLLQRLRDEAHRFALSGHRSRKLKHDLSSLLESIPGVGPVRRRVLLEHFGSVEKIKEAEADDLMKVAGISPALANKIAEFYNTKA